MTASSEGELDRSSICPRCGAAESLAPIVYGLVALDATTADRPKERVFGGCLVFDDDPTHLCRACNYAIKVGP